MKILALVASQDSTVEDVKTNGRKADAGTDR